MTRLSAPVIAAVLMVGAPAPAATLLLAGDDSISAFANAVDYLHDQLDARPGDRAPIETIYARGDRGPAAREVTRGILARIAALKPGVGGQCLIFITSHGESGAGLFVAGGDPILPAALDQALDQGCANVPTVVIVSACFSGQFITERTSRPNRVILTAARRDRTSFGCQAGETFTIFDRCLLAALPRAADWHLVYERARLCVTAAEREMGVKPSEPQAWFGAAIEPAAASLPPRPDEPEIRFTMSGKPIQATAGWKAGRATIAAYRAADAPKALTLGPQGEIFWAGNDAGRQIDAVARHALMLCQSSTHTACVLYAENDQTVRLMPSGLLPLHPLIDDRQADPPSGPVR